MLRSLFAGISGLRVNQTMLDVTGNNIANANTTGFKASTTVFQDTLSQMLTGASGPNAERGGTNPIQVGLGVQLAATATNLGQGSAQTTGRTTDVMISGDGFFVVESGGERLYTRAGAFALDRDGNLVTSSGARVIGVDGNPIRIDPAQELESMSIGSDGTLTGIVNGVGTPLGQLAVATFTNPMGLEKVGETSFRQSANSGAAELGAPGAAGRGDIMAGALEMSNVDLAAEFTNLILAQRGFQASSRVITTSDSVLEDLVNLKR
ncbi:flagellar hook-basal body complex protein [Nocardioides sp. SOB77]|uniref:Flagellar hook protein FlgE n=1 Tax=Nocardioides oceani TaxID=3058369 RepID=A0ABT8FFU2_9ACTN|nr:flagellar hook-basal body complex protein [Nocardioides oceani]MDN4173554.1 flagellar hook-basal body complex protein [Nocardioides oceani]